MTLANHVKMGRSIYAKMRKSGMKLCKSMFILGNIAPDLFFSYIYRPHQRESSGSYLDAKLHRLFITGSDPGAMAFSFRLGVMAHYICDFLCYAHTPAFTGSAREHMRYEKSQTVARDTRPFNKHSAIGLNPDALASTLSAYIARRERLLYADSALAAHDITVAVHISVWAACVVYLHKIPATGAAAQGGNDPTVGIA